MKFIKSKEYLRKLFLEAMCDDKDVHQDVKIRIVYDWSKSKLRAYCQDVNSYLQFPNKLRQEGAEYLADIVQVKPEGRSTFFRVMKESIRHPNGELV